MDGAGAGAEPGLVRGGGIRFGRFGAAVAGFGSEPGFGSAGFGSGFVSGTGFGAAGGSGSGTGSALLLPVSASPISADGK